MNRFFLAIGLIVLLGLTFLASKTYFHQTASPFDHIDREQITFEDNKIIIEGVSEDIGYVISGWMRGKSMLPVISNTTNQILIKPKSVDDIHIGDIIVFNHSVNNRIYAHRVIEIKEDELGLFFKTRGANNWISDRDKVRYEKVSYIVVGVLY